MVAPRQNLNSLVRPPAASPESELPGRTAGGGSRPREGLDACAEVPLHVRPVLTYSELAALGIIPERTLRRLVAIGTVKRSVLRLGRSVRFVVQDLLDELRGTQE